MSRLLDVTAAHELTSPTLPSAATESLGSPGGLTLAFGDAGRIWAAQQSGAEIPDEQLDRLFAAARRDERIPPGLCDGLCGIALVLDLCGRRDDALEILGLAFDQLLDPDDLSLYSGTAGLGLTLLHFADATGEPQYLELAVELGAHAAAKLAAAGESTLPGPLFGPTGSAIFLLRLHARTGRSEHLEAATLAMGDDRSRRT